MFIVCLFGTTALRAQIGIGTAAPDSSAILDIKSQTKGLLIPRMSASQRNMIPSPVKGLMVFDNDSTCFYYFDGIIWQPVKGSGCWVNNGASTVLATTGNNVGIGNTSPDPSAILDLTNTRGGLLLPIMDSTQRATISSPALV